MTDAIDDVLKQWRTARPDVNVQAMAVVGRILRLAGELERRANEALQPYGLAIWGFDVLGTLRRSGPPYALTPTALTRATMLTTGAMTNRIDRLVELGFVKRVPMADDRRSLHVKLTSKGKRVVDAAAIARFAEAESAVDSLSAADRKHLAELLSKLIRGIETEK
jgi:DNA-binding MarR family transcriptional regulator